VEARKGGGLEPKSESGRTRLISIPDLGDEGGGRNH